MDLPPLLLRADAGARMGTGHVMRCLALAQAWQDRGGRAWLARGPALPAPSGLEERLRTEGVTLAHLAAAPGSPDDAAETTSLARAVGAGWIVVDGYHFDADYLRRIKGSGLRLLALDDQGYPGHVWADLLLNQNLHADAALYPNVEPSSHLLLGTRYALLRREFRAWRGRRRTPPHTARRVLVTLGGADPDNASLKVLDALRCVEVRGLSVRLVVGASNPHRDSLARAVAAAAAGGLRVEWVDNTPHMPDLMAWADVAVSAAGTTCWELARMQVPSVVLVLADNQRHNAAGLAEAGVAWNLGWPPDCPPERLAGALTQLLTSRPTRLAMRRLGRTLVDGEGAPRVVERMVGSLLRLRPALGRDCELLFAWANDPLTRQMSLRPEPIPWEEHRRWFDRVVGDPALFLVIAEAWQAGRWTPVGQVRVDGEGVISIALAPEQRGRGLGRPVLQLAVAAYRARCAVDGSAPPLTAYIKPENPASQRIFAQAGFQPAGWAEVLGQWLLKLTRC